MPERSTMEVIFLIRQLMERHRKQKNDLHMIFIDLEKVYDKIPRNIMWWALEINESQQSTLPLLRICTQML
jgi:hypothetical protein